MLITIISVIILILSAVIHEYAHGWMAWRLGDNTAKDEGRLTLNPLVHLDLIGSVILPLLLIISKAGFFLAWAKPVPYNPYNLRDRRYGELKVALAGPATNIIIALISGIVARFLPLALETKQDLLVGFLSGNAEQVFSLTSGSVVAGLEVVALMVCFINLALAVFNLIPVPPLDGSKILSAFLPTAGKEFFWKVEQYGFIVLFALIYLGAFSFISTIVFWAFNVITGIL